MLVEPVDLLLMWFDELQTGQASLARLLGIHDVPDPDTDDSVEPQTDEIEARDVRFAYRGDRDVLHGVDLDVAPGSRVAVVGPSGAGKSTLGRLLAGIHGPRTGHVTMGGVALAGHAGGDRARATSRWSPRSTTSSSARCATTSASPSRAPPTRSCWPR